MNAQRVLNNPNIKGLKDAVQNISLYDVKAYVRKAQNVMMNFSPMEAKVREATNNEPWGASGSLMQEIADGTFNYASFNEIMPMIYKRFTEKTASEWRQIYKALQLLEFLVKHGSERVIDDARAHLATISMLRSFHYTDSNGKDQGINVRNRSKELVALLGDDERIRTERKKARAAKDKYVGVSSFESGLGGGSSSNSGGFGGTGKKYGGFGSDSAEYGGYSGGVYGDGGGFGGESSSRAYAAPSRSSGQFEEYDAGGEDDTTTTAYAAISPPTQSSSEPVKAKAPAVDLFSFDDDDNGNSVLAATPPPASPAPAAAAFAAPAPAPASSSAFDDDFDDFQSATPTPTSPKPQASAAASITGLYNQPMQQPTMTMPSFTQPSYVQQPQQFSQFGQFAAAPAAATTTPTLATTTNTATYQTSTGPNYNISGFSSGASSFGTASAGNGAGAAAAKKKDDVFGSLWSTAASGVTKKSGTNSTASSNVSMAKLAQQTATAGIWDQARSNSSTSTVPTLASNVNNNNNSAATSGSGSASDDLLLL